MSALTDTTLPDEMVTIIEDVGFLESIPLWAITLLGSLFIWVLSLIMILTVYSRFFKLYLATAIAPIPMASFAGQPSSSIGVAFLKSYAAICLADGIFFALVGLAALSWVVTLLRRLWGLLEDWREERTMAELLAYRVRQARAAGEYAINTEGLW